MRITAATPEQPARLEIGSVKIPLPKWGPPVVLVAALAAGGVYGWDWLEQKHAGEARIKSSDLVQLNESQRHFGEEPERVSSLRDDVRGQILTTLFRSGCVALTIKSPDPSVPIAHPFYPVAAHNVLTIADARQLTQPTIGETPAHASEPPPPEPANCIRPWTAHPPNPSGDAFSWRYGQRFDACRVEVVREWQDGCSMVETFNGCVQTWRDARWLTCTH